MKKYIIASLVLAFCGSSIFAQNKDTKKADKRFDRFEFVKAVKEYKNVVSDGDATPYVYKRLGDSYYNLGDSKNAAIYYKKYLDGDTAPNTEYYYRYAEMLKRNGKYKMSNDMMGEFAQKAPSDARAKAFKANPDYLSQLMDMEPSFKVSKLDFNSDVQDFGAYEHDGKLYFVSARNDSRRKYGWNQQPTLDVYVATKKVGKYQDPKLVKGDINTKFHEGMVAITNDNKTMYFTRNDYTDHDYEKSSDGIGQLKVYRAKKIDKGWGDVESLPFNNKEYSTGHVALSPDNKTLYFASDMPGGYGQADLYRVTINKDGSFGKPENLGSTINTPGKEGFPFIDPEGTLYFSSDGQLGMGGRDVYRAKVQGNGFGEPENLGKPVNSSSDDYAFSYDPATKQGFVTSNRTASSDDYEIANDNIYRVDKIQVKEIMVYAKVIDAETGRPIANARVGIYNDQKKLVNKKMSGKDGLAKFTLPGGDNNYALQVDAKDYHPKAQGVKHQMEGKINAVVELQPVEKIIAPDKINLKPIFFAFDKSNIGKEAAFELDKLVDIMKKHPKMVIHVVAHTDKRGSAEYNKQLSQRRAKSTVQYVIDNGVDKSRIDGEGVGESQPKIKCDKCTKEQYHKNRRSDFNIVKQ